MKKTYKLRSLKGQEIATIKASDASAAARKVKMSRPSMKVIVLTSRTQSKKRTVYVFTAAFEKLSTPIKRNGKVVKKRAVVKKQAMWLNT